MTVTINGSGTIGGIAAGGLPDATITQPDMAAGVAGTGQAFSATASSNQSISANTLTKIVLDTEVFDTANCYNPSTYRFTPNVAGYYSVSAGTGWAAATNVYLIMMLAKNGSAVRTLGYLTSNAGYYTTMVGSSVIYMNGTTDYIELYAQAGSNISVINATYAYSTYMEAALVRAA